MDSASAPPAMVELISRSMQPQDLPSQVDLPPTIGEPDHLQDLELMMHWCTTTYRSLARDVTTQMIWQTTIPQISLRFPSLRHGLLALSALQLAGASTSPEQKTSYLILAREHQDLALVGVHVDDVDNLTMTECNAHFALCGVLVIFSFAYCLIDEGEKDDEYESPELLDEFVEVSELTRWLLGAMMLTVDRVAAGDLGELVRPQEGHRAMPNMSRLVVLPLRRKNEEEAARDSTHEKEIYAQTIDHLATSLEQLMSGREFKDFAFCWTVRTPVRFQDLVRERQPFALVVLAHYAVILHRLRDTWWMGEWGNRILQEIGDYLKPQWRELISWPLDATGCALS